MYCRQNMDTELYEISEKGGRSAWYINKLVYNFAASGITQMYSIMIYTIIYKSSIIFNDTLNSPDHCNPWSLSADNHFIIKLVNLKGLHLDLKIDILISDPQQEQSTQEISPSPDDHCLVWWFYMMTGGARFPLKTVVMICGLLVAAAAVPVSAVLLLSLNFVLRLNSCICYL